MKAKYFLAGLSLMMLLFLAPEVMAQCSICTKTAAELGPDAGRGLNAGILYLAAIPLAMGSIIGYRWWKNNQLVEQEEE